jgi:hypothetical protein
MNFEEQLETLRAEVKDLTAKSLKANEEPWHKKPATIISILALLFSFSTTIFSAYKARTDEILANRRDVRSIIEKLTRIPINNYELMQKYKNEASGQALSGMINQENILLATQAAELIDRFPASFTSTEYFAVAGALASSNIMSKVPIMFQRAIDSATTSNDLNVAARSYAAYLYSKGNYTEGKRLYEESLKVWNKFPEQNTYFVNSVELVTYLYWSQADYAAGNKNDAKSRLAEARKRLDNLAPGPYTESLRGQIEYWAKFID